MLMNRIEAFFYTLMRDELPTGVVRKIVESLTKDPMMTWYVPTSESLAQLAREYAALLREPHETDEQDTSGFVTYDTNDGRCGLCGQSSCSGSCFK